VEAEKKTTEGGNEKDIDTLTTTKGGEKRVDPRKKLMQGITSEITAGKASTDPQKHS